jgi:hypothetical protein
VEFGKTDEGGPLATSIDESSRLGVAQPHQLQGAG